GRASRDVKVVAGGAWFAKSAIISPDLDSKHANSRTRNSTPIPRGIHRDRKWPDKAITRPSQRNKPEPSPNRSIIQKKFRQIAQKLPLRESGSGVSAYDKTKKGM